MTTSSPSKATKYVLVPYHWMVARAPPSTPMTSSTKRTSRHVNRVRGPRAAQVRPGDERTVAAHLELGLEDVGEVGLALLARDRRTVIHQEDGNRARPLWDVPLKVLRGDRPLDDV